MEQLLPCARQNHMTVRGRMARVADDNERRTLQPIDALPPTDEQDRTISVFLDGAHIRCRPEYQKRHLDVVVGRIESAGKNRRFAFEPSSSLSPRALIRAQLQSAGWQPGESLTVLTDGEPGLANHVRSVTGQPVTHILDWWHISMRIKHIENAAAGLQEISAGRKGADKLPWLAERLRWLVWHGKIAKALEGIRHLRWRAESPQDLSRPSVGLAIRRIRKRCEFLATYLENNAGSIPDYGKRHRESLPVSTRRPAQRASSMISPIISEWENVEGCAGHPRARTALRSPERPYSMEGLACRTGEMQLDPQLLSTPGVELGKKFIV